LQVKNSINIGLRLHVGRKHNITVTTKLKSTPKVYLLLVMKELCRASTEDLAEQNTDDYTLLFMFPDSVPNTNEDIKYLILFSCAHKFYRILRATYKFQVQYHKFDIKHVHY